MCKYDTFQASAKSKNQIYLDRGFGKGVWFGQGKFSQESSQSVKMFELDRITALVTVF